MGLALSRSIPRKYILVVPTPYVPYLGVWDIKGLVPPVVMGLVMVLYFDLVESRLVGIYEEGV